jgi:N-acetylneuraminic acid mutarotase
MQQVFVSHAKEDEAEALRVCGMLEADGIRCWLPSRDAPGAKDKAPDVLDAIRRSDLVLLVFSAAANASASVLREIEKAVAYERAVLPVRVDGATPNASLQHYLDLAPQVGTVASLQVAQQQDESGLPVVAVESRRPRRRTLVLGIASVVVVAAVVAGLGLGLKPHHTVWTMISPSGAVPAGRAASAMDYDPNSKRLIMFGGAGTTENLNDTWAYDPASKIWIGCKPSGDLPSKRDYHSLVYDPTSHRLLLFGGIAWATGEALNETWVYDPAANAWSLLNPAGDLPPARAWCTIVSDHDTGKLILFGGMAGDLANELDPEIRLNDLWAYDPVSITWTNLNPTGAVPAARFAQMMAYDPSTRRVIMFGGATGTSRFNDTWAYDSASNAWTELKPAGALPTPRGGGCMTYDPSSKRMIVFGGGKSLTELFNDIWAYDPSANTWTELTVSGLRPGVRGVPNMTYDPVTKRLIMFGGIDDTGAFLDETWALSP